MLLFTSVSTGSLFLSAHFIDGTDFSLIRQENKKKTKSVQLKSTNVISRFMLPKIIKGKKIVMTQWVFFVCLSACCLGLVACII